MGRWSTGSMARFDADAGKWFELTPLRYQLPGYRNDTWDANWLVVSFEAAIGRRVRKAWVPVFQTTELAILAEFCRAAAAGQLTCGASFTAIEPVFQLHLRHAIEGAL